MTGWDPRISIDEVQKILGKWYSPWSKRKWIRDRECREDFLRLANIAMYCQMYHKDCDTPEEYAE